MGSSSSKSSDDRQPSELSQELRIALRVPEGLSTPEKEQTATTESSSNRDKKTDEKKTDDANTTTDSLLTNTDHRSVKVLKILSSPEFNPSKDIRVEHILEIVDNAWEEKHSGVEKVLSKIIEDMIGDNEGLLEKLVISCALNQKCWLAMEMAMKKLIQLKKKKNDNNKDTVDSQHVAIFNIAVLGTPLKFLTKMITELKWVATTATASEKNQVRSQFRLLTQRLAREHETPKTEEQKMKSNIQKKLQNERVLALTQPNEEVSKECLISFLRISGVADLLDREKDIEKEAMKIQTSEVVKEVLNICTKPWSQLEATVNETPMSWTCSGCNTRQLVTQTALTLKKSGLTFPATAKVLSFLVCPCGSGEEKKNE